MPTRTSKSSEAAPAAASGGVGHRVAEEIEANAIEAKVRVAVEAATVAERKRCAAVIRAGRIGSESERNALAKLLGE